MHSVGATTSMAGQEAPHLRCPPLDRGMPTREHPQQQAMEALAWERARTQQKEEITRQLQLLRPLVQKRSQRLAASCRGAPVSEAHPRASDGADAGPIPCHVLPPSVQSHEVPAGGPPRPRHAGGEQAQGQPQADSVQSWWYAQQQQVRPQQIVAQLWMQQPHA